MSANLILSPIDTSFVINVRDSIDLSPEKNEYSLSLASNSLIGKKIRSPSFYRFSSQCRERKLSLSENIEIIEPSKNKLRQMMKYDNKAILSAKEKGEALDAYSPKILLPDNWPCIGLSLCVGLSVGLVSAFSVVLATGNVDYALLSGLSFFVVGVCAGLVSKYCIEKKNSEKFVALLEEKEEAIKNIAENIKNDYKTIKDLLSIKIKYKDDSYEKNIIEEILTFASPLHEDKNGNHRYRETYQALKKEISKIEYTIGQYNKFHAKIKIDQVDRENKLIGATDSILKDINYPLVRKNEEVHLKKFESSKSDSSSIVYISSSSDG